MFLRNTLAKLHSILRKIALASKFDCGMSVSLRVSFVQALTGFLPASFHHSWNHSHSSQFSETNTGHFKLSQISMGPACKLTTVF